MEKFSKLGDGVDLKNTGGVRLCFALFYVKSGVKSHPCFQSASATMTSTVDAAHLLGNHLRSHIYRTQPYLNPTPETGLKRTGWKTIFPLKVLHQN